MYLKECNILGLQDSQPSTLCPLCCFNGIEHYGHCNVKYVIGIKVETILEVVNDQYQQYN